MNLTDLSRFILTLLSVVFLTGFNAALAGFNIEIPGTTISGEVSGGTFNGNTEKAFYMTLLAYPSDLSGMQVFFPESEVAAPIEEVCMLNRRLISYDEYHEEFPPFLSGCDGDFNESGECLSGLSINFRNAMIIPVDGIWFDIDPTTSPLALSLIFPACVEI
jgi:hypothetical protein